ncbi:uncharacterized protein LOC130970854 [Arachis stenosperma]|uniref:uncharacterized protein LOC130970854 n=1 Tax=Arachis stenosperma TaxID=217475 RepID=UPI0025ABC157|nr:uncharacterized protein LOC130970854 [Arachis stenosperma]XP_057753039.1 uncharacterized protein LOC130970854 [Arachis stenosperma]
MPLLWSNGVVDPLLSYGRGRELLGRRHKSLIYGPDFTDVIIIRFSILEYPSYILQIIDDVVEAFQLLTKREYARWLVKLNSSLERLAPEKDYGPDEEDDEEGNAGDRLFSVPMPKMMLVLDLG